MIATVTEAVGSMYAERIDLPEDAPADAVSPSEYPPTNRGGMIYEERSCQKHGGSTTRSPGRGR